MFVSFDFPFTVRSYKTHGLYYGMHKAHSVLRFMVYRGGIVFCMWDGSCVLRSKRMDVLISCGCAGLRVLVIGAFVFTVHWYH